MFFCCSGEDSGGNTVVVVEPASAVPDEVKPTDDTAAEEATTQSDEKARQEEDAEKKRRADEAEKKRKADEEAAAQAAEAEKNKQREDEARKKEAADATAAREEAAKAVDAGLPLTFRDASGEKTYTVNFTTKPLGMDFNQNAKPVKVTKAFGAAKKLGVSPGSDLIAIAGTDVEALDFGQMLVVLKEKIVPLTPDGLMITFRDESGGQRPIVFPTKPLGMDFDHGKKPIRIKNVLGAAQGLGVEANWELMNIAGTDVGEMDFEKILDLLRAQIESLPTKD